MGVRKQPIHPSGMQSAERVLEIARELAAANPAFAGVLGPGAGNRATNSYLTALQERVERELAPGSCEVPLCAGTDMCEDFYFPQEATIVEVALGLPNPNCEFEKDIFKALLAKAEGYPVSTLFFISRPGGRQKCQQPGRKSVISWAEQQHGLKIEVHDLDGERRVRTRRRRVRIV